MNKTEDGKTLVFTKNDLFPSFRKNYTNKSIVTRSQLRCANSIMSKADKVFFVHDDGCTIILKSCCENLDSKEQKPRFNRDVIREMRRLANEKFDNIVKISHFRPYAYCIAKPSAWCAVFVVPPQDNELQASDVKEILIQDSCVENARSGDWCEIAYIYTKDGSGFNYVLKNNSR